MRKAMELGIDAMIVSNHGGRQIDNAIASLDALVAIRDAVGPHPTILLDSGIRSGTDVLIALALGANACLIGRPYIYGLAIAGADGVRQVIENIVAELDLTMGLAWRSEHQRSHSRPARRGHRQSTRRGGSVALVPDQVTQMRDVGSADC